MAKGEKKEIKTRRDWEHNQELVSAKYFEYLNKFGRIPTRKKLSEITGLAEKTIQRHMEEPVFERNCHSLRAIQDKMLAEFTKKVKKSSRKDMWELYFQITEKEFVVKRVDVTTKGAKVEPSNTITLNID